MQDLQHAIDLSPDTDGRAECHMERGMIYQKLHDFARAVKDLKQVCSLNKLPSALEVYSHALLTARLLLCACTELQKCQCHCLHVHIHALHLWGHLTGALCDQVRIMFSSPGVIFVSI